MSRTAHALVLLPLGLGTLACSGLFGDGVTETDALIGEPETSVPSPSAELARGFVDPAHRARVEDELCAGSIPVWGAVTQAVETSHRQGELHDDVTRRYTGLVAGCADLGYCAMARNKLAATDSEIQAFWLHALATCGDLRDRPLFRDYDVEPLAAVAFYTAGAQPMPREGADEGALILAVERLIQRGVADEPLPTAIGELFAHDHPEAAERLAALAPEAALNIQDLLWPALAGQSHPAAVAAVEAWCQENPTRNEVCGIAPMGAAPDHAQRWLAALAATDDPVRAAGLLDAHPELHDRARAELAPAENADVHSLLDDDQHHFDTADTIGISARPDKTEAASFDHDLGAVLEGRGRLVVIDVPADQPWATERTARHLARAASPDLDEARFHTLPASEASPHGALALELGPRHFEIALPEGDPTDAVRTLLNHVLQATDSELRLYAAPDGWFAAAPPDAVDTLVSEGVISPPG